MQVKLIDNMGSDLTVVNAARVSFNKESEWESITPAGPVENLLTEKDEKLINYLARHNHWTPFGHCFLQFRIKAPVFVARQLAKHQVGLVWNEVSRRYIDDDPEFFIPIKWRGKAKNKKQGSVEDRNINYNTSPLMTYVSQCYKNMLNAGIAPEMARMFLPQNMYTEWYWSGSLAAFARVCSLRIKDDVQQETRFIANCINLECKDIYPVSWKALEKNDFDTWKKCNKPEWFEIDDLNDNKSFWHGLGLPDETRN